MSLGFKFFGLAELAIAIALVSVAVTVAFEWWKRRR